MTQSERATSSTFDNETAPLLQNQEQEQQTKPEESLKDLNGHFKSLFASFFICIVAGLNDGALGTIIPSIKKYYNISNETISTLFLCSAFGFFIAAGLNGYIVHRIGQIKTLYLGSITMLVAFSTISLGLPFHIMACAMPFAGAGMALLDAAVNVFVANLPLATLMLNILHAVYGVGAMISPMVAGFLLRNEYPWTGMYIFLAGVAILNIIGITIGFYHVDFEEVQHEQEDSTVVKQDHGELTKLAILNKVTLIGAAYILVYVGDEVVLGGWGYTWLTQGRHGDPLAMADVMSGYWAGLASGRIVLGYLAGRFGEKLMISLFTIMIIAGLVVMLVSTDIIVDSTVLVTLGFLLGPMFPTTISLASKALPRSYHATSIGFMAALGAGGAALFPFLTGQIAGKFGILIMPTACIIFSAMMLILWAFIPSDKPLFAKLCGK